MTNFDTARQALEVSMNSSGSAMAEHEKWSQSLEAQLLKLQATWQSLSQSFLKSDFLKTALDGVIGLVNGVNSLIDTIGVIPTLVGAFSMFKSFNGGGFFKLIEDEASLSGKRITNIFKDVWRTIRQTANTSFSFGEGFNEILQSDIDAINNYIESLGKGIPAEQAFSETMRSASIEAQNFAKTTNASAKELSKFETFAKKSKITDMASSFKNARMLIDEYNSGLKTCGLNQTEFLDSVGKSNSGFAKYLKSVGQGNATMKGYVGSLIGAKVATIGLQIATTALNAAISMGITALISWGISKLDEWIETSEELAERIEEVTTAYKDQYAEMMKIKGSYNTADADSMISKYGKLSKGVNALGENVSLTADEYSEYQSIVDTIAGQIPSLVTGYNEQGNAILSCAGNVDTLAEAYRNLIIEQNDAVLDTGKDIFKDFENDLKKSPAYTRKKVDDPYSRLGYRYEDTIDVGYINTLERLINKSGRLQERDIEKMELEEIVQLSNTFAENGIEKSWNESARSHVYRAIREEKSKLQSILKEAQEDLNAYAEDLGSVTNAYFSTAFLGGDGDIEDYSHLSDRMQSIITSISSGFDTEFYTQFLDEENPYEALINYYNDLLAKFDSLSNADAAQFEAAFDLQTKFNGGEISYGEYVKGIQDAGSIVDSFGLQDKELEAQIKVSLGLTEKDGKWVVEEYETMLNRLTSKEYGIQMKTEEAEAFLNSLSSSEYAIAVDLITSGKIDLSDFDIKSLRKYIEDEAKLLEAMNFTIAMDVETESLTAFNTAMAESVSGAGLSSEVIAALKGRYAELESKGYDLSSMFEETSNGIHLNRKAVAELEEAYASNKLAEVDDNLKILKDEYDSLTEQIDNANNASERASLYVERDAILQKINDLATLGAQYEGLTSAYQEWQNAEAAGQERDMYENVISGLENIDNELSRGWVDDGTIEFLELLTGKELSSAPVEDLKEAYNGLNTAINDAGYSIRDFFTVNEDGESTNTGVYNFLKTVEKAYDNVIQRDENGKIKSFDFSVVAEKDENGNVINGDQVIAEALGISEELVQIMLRAADDAGFVINLEGAYTQLADLKTEAEAARDSLISLRDAGNLNAVNGKNIDTDLNFNFDATGTDLVEEQARAVELVNKFKKDGKIDLSIKGAQEALDIAEYLTIKLDDLTEPRYMELDASDVDEEFREPLEKLQEFEKLTKEKHLLTLSGDTDGLKDVENEMNEIVDYIYKNDDLKVKLGIDENATQAEIKDMLEKGEVEIPATVEVQMQMSDDLKDMRLMMMNQLGLASDEEVKLKIGYDIDESEVNKLTPDQQKVFVEYIEKDEKTKEWFNSLTNNKREILINLVASGVDLSTLEEDKREIIIEYVGKNQEWFDTLDKNEQKIVVDIVANHKKWFEALNEDKKEIVIDLVSKGVDLNSLENKSVVIDFVAKNQEWFDKLDDRKQKIVVNLVSQGIDLSIFDEDQREILINLSSEGVDLSIFDNKEIKIVLKYIEENQTLLDTLDDETKEVVLKYVAKGKSLEELTEEEQEVIVKLIGDDSELKGWTPDQKEAIVKYIVDGGDVEGWTPEDKKAFAQYIVDGGDPDSYVPPSKTQMVKADLDSSEPDNKKYGEKTQPVLAKLNSSAVDNYKPPEKTMTIWAKIKKKASDLWNKLTGGSDVNGTANVNGTALANGTIKSGKAFKRGNWRTKTTETALVGELGREIIVTPENRWYTVGDYGAEFTKIPKGSIVFNHRQTEELLKNGKVTSGGGRARALANGTAFLGGTAYAYTGGSSGADGGWDEVVGNPVTGKKYGKSSDSDDAKDEFEETFDWIETAIERIEREIDNLDTVASSTYRSWSERNEALENEISAVGDEIELQQKALEEYTRAANAVGLSSEWISKIQNGAIDIETITDETLAEKIQDYQKWYEKILECKDAILDLTEKENDLIQQRFDNVQARYEGMLSVVEHEKNMLEEYLNQSEAQGWLTSKGYYEALINNAQESISTMQAEKAALMAELGNFEVGSEQWYENVKAIDDITLAIEQANTSTLEWQQSIQQLDWEIFDLIQDKISAITKESDFLIELMSNKKLYDDNGRLTNEGKATMGLHGVNYNVLMHQADLARAEAERIKAQMASDPFDMELEERYREMISLQQEYILAAEDSKNAIRDMVEDGIDLELEALQEKIDLYKDALDSQRELYEYSKRVEEQTKNLASLQKQFVSIENDNSEEGKKRKQELIVAIREAEDELEETEMEKYFSDTEKLLDSLFLEYELILNERLDNIDLLIESMIAEINADASIIGDTINAATADVGYTLSGEMQSIWADGNNAIAMYTDRIAFNQTNTYNAICGIKNSVDSMVAQLGAIAAQKAAQAANSTAAKTPQANTKPTTNNDKPSNTTTVPTTNTNKGNTPTDDQLMGIAASIWVYGQNSGWGNDPIRSGKLTEKFSLEIAKKVQSLINANGPNGNLYDFWVDHNKNLSKYYYNAFALGKKNIDKSQLAWTQENGEEFIIRPSDGAILTPIAKNDSVLNANASNNLWNMANSPADFIKENLNLGNNAPNNPASQNSVTQHFDKVIFSMPNVRNYDELITQMQRDPNFERLVEAMSIGKLSGKSSLAKGKAIR